MNLIIFLVIEKHILYNNIILKQFLFVLFAQNKFGD